MLRPSLPARCGPRQRYAAGRLVMELRQKGLPALDAHLSQAAAAGPALAPRRLALSRPAVDEIVGAARKPGAWAAAAALLQQCATMALEPQRGVAEEAACRVLSASPAWLEALASLGARHPDAAVAGLADAHRVGAALTAAARCADPWPSTAAPVALARLMAGLGLEQQLLTLRRLRHRDAATAARATFAAALASADPRTVDWERHALAGGRVDVGGRGVRLGPRAWLKAIGAPPVTEGRVVPRVAAAARLAAEHTPTPALAGRAVAALGVDLPLRDAPSEAASLTRSVAAFALPAIVAQLSRGGHTPEAVAEALDELGVALQIAAPTLPATLELPVAWGDASAAVPGWARLGPGTPLDTESAAGRIAAAAVPGSTAWASLAPRAELVTVRRTAPSDPRALLGYLVVDLRAAAAALRAWEGRGPEYDTSPGAVACGGVAVVAKPALWTTASGPFEAARLRPKTGGGDVLTAVRHCTEAAPRGGLVQRLDQGTSGVLLLARTAAAFDVLRAPSVAKALPPKASVDRSALPFARLHAQRVKTYVALCAVVVPPVDTVLRVTTPLDGKPATSVFTVAAQGASLCLVRCRLHTGRKHQVRRHLAAAGLPVLNDARYGSVLAMSAALPPARLGLHAAETAFVLEHGRRCVATVELPADMRRAAELDGITP